MSASWTGKRFISLFLLLMLVFSIASVVSADVGHDPLEKKAGGYVVKLVIAEPVTYGHNEITIELTDADGHAVTGARVEVEAMIIDDHAKDKDDDHAKTDKKAAKDDDHDEAEEKAAKDDGHDEAEEKAAKDDDHDEAEEKAAKDDDHDEAEEKSAKDDDHDEAEEKAAKDDDHDEAEEKSAKDDDHDKAQAVVLTAGSTPGAYHGELDLNKSGMWQLVVHFEVDGVENKVDYEIEVPLAVSKAAVLTGFLVVNAGAVAAAAVQKRRLAAARQRKLQARSDGQVARTDLKEIIANENTERND
jgi:hypothetical protein